jgi:luciferase family oxidoreductase group 1
VEPLDDPAPLAAIPLSVLDVAPVGEGISTTDALRATLDLARMAERLGFTRFWLAEHHNMPGIASAAPAVLGAAVAAATERIRVGSGGVMLPNHPPLVVAEQFGTLEGLFPGRIDLGIGRAPGTDQLTARALRRRPDTLTDDAFPRELGELLGFLGGRFPEQHPYAAIRSVPEPDQVPPLWLLGSSGYSAQVAGYLGLPFAFAHHFSAENTLPALDLYRNTFRPSEWLAQPYAMVAVQVLVADTDDEADRLARSGALSFLRLRQGRPGRIPTAEEAAAYPWTEEELAFVAQRRHGQAIGSPSTVRTALSDLAFATGADELMATTQVHGAAPRLRSYEMLRALYGPDPLPLGLGSTDDRVPSARD